MAQPILEMPDGNAVAYGSWAVRSLLLLDYVNVNDEFRQNLTSEILAAAPTDQMERELESVLAKTTRAERRRIARGVKHYG